MFTPSKKLRVPIDVSTVSGAVIDTGMSVVISSFFGFEHTTVARVCQVELAESYHHKHQNLAKGDTEKGGLPIGRPDDRIAIDTSTHQDAAHQWNQERRNGQGFHDP